MYRSDVFAILTSYREKYWDNIIQAFSHPHNAAWMKMESIDNREPISVLSLTFKSKDNIVN